jgi:hypothetical protein
MPDMQDPDLLALIISARTSGSSVAGAMNGKSFSQPIWRSIADVAD